MPTSLQPAFVLHTRAYRDTSLLVDFFCQEEGRIRAVARAVRRAKSTLKSLLQPFTPLLISWGGKHELVTLYQAEAHGRAHPLLAQRLLSGLYVNELLARLLQPHDPHPQLFAVYTQTLQALQQSKQLEATLRLFELQLLRELGFGLQLAHCKEPAAEVMPEAYYRFCPGEGLILASASVTADNLARDLFSGQRLLAIHQQTLIDPETLRDAKRLLRLALAPLLAGRPVRSRELFISAEKTL
jgi:DNA repair protein RecO (recombination protein O)